MAQQHVLSLVTALISLWAEGTRTWQGAADLRCAVSRANAKQGLSWGRGGSGDAEALCGPLIRETRQCNDRNSEAQRSELGPWFYPR